jgi:signal transduction histidine kinase
MREPDRLEASVTRADPSPHISEVSQRARYAAEVAVLATIYVVAARAGLQLDAVSGFATLVWPPTGIALAALLVRGYRLWPGVAIGAFVANLLTDAPVLVAAGIAVGNSLEALLGTFALRRIEGFRPSLDRLQDALGLIILAAGFSTLVSATIGVSSLYLGGIVPLARFGVTWRAWWIGDAIGALLVAPVILVWATPGRPQLRRKILFEATAVGAAVAVTSLVIFASAPERNDAPFRHAYVLFPPLIWAAVRFGQRGAVSAAFVASVIAVWGTVKGYGPFVEPTLHESLFEVQTFMGIVAATFLVFGASVSERRRAAEELRAARDIAASANRAKAEFLAVMSHELRTPLNAISGYVDMLNLGIKGSLTDEQREAMMRIQRNQQHLTALIDDVLSFAKIEEGRLAFAVRTVQLREVLEDVKSLLEPDLIKKDLALACDACDSSVQVRADPEKLRQILVNLLANAVKFTDRAGRITVGAVRDGDTVRVSVRDTGIGIPAEQIARVFEPFFQVSGGMTRRYPGVGLGLAIARDLARAMEGNVSIESRVGEGSTVTLSLPAA